MPGPSEDRKLGPRKPVRKPAAGEGRESAPEVTAERVARLGRLMTPRSHGEMLLLRAASRYTYYSTTSIVQLASVCHALREPESWGTSVPPNTRLPCGHARL